MSKLETEKKEMSLVQQMVFEQNKIRKSALIIRAINHPLRQKILIELDRKVSTVTDIYIKFRLEQSVASQHLAILRRSGIVKTERDGKFVYYSINRKKVSALWSIIDELSRM